MTDPIESNVHSLVTREEALSTLDDLVRSAGMGIRCTFVPHHSRIVN